MYSCISDKTTSTLNKFYDCDQGILSYNDLRDDILQISVKELVLAHGQYFYNGSVNTQVTQAKLENLLSMFIAKKQKGKKKNDQIRQLQDNLVEIATINHKWGELITKMKYGKDFETVCLKYSIYIITNTFEDIQNKNIERILRRDAPLIREFPLPNYIINTIISYKDSIVLVESGKDNLYQFDTYGLYLEYYPKLLNWDFDDMNNVCQIMLRSGNFNVSSWLQYFNDKYLQRYHEIGIGKQMRYNYMQLNFIFEKEFAKVTPQYSDLYGNKYKSNESWWSFNSIWNTINWPAWV